MESWTNYHNHSHYCDGVDTLETHILSAVEKGVLSLGFSSHNPVLFENKWSMPQEKLPAYLSELDALKKKYESQISIHKGLEIDYFPDNSLPIQDWKKMADLDYTIGSVHFVGGFDDGTPWEIDGTLSVFKKGLLEIYQNDIQKALKDYYEILYHMLEHDCPDILGHFDKIKMHNCKEKFFDETARWYVKLIDELLERAKDKHVIIEVNTRGIYKKLTDEPYPGIPFLKKIKNLNIPICLNSDAHHPKEIILEYENTAKLLKNIGFKELMVLKNNSWQAVGFEETGIFYL